ncbi:hypothetical protein D3C87_1492110 [compost metagenome]
MTAETAAQCRASRSHQNRNVHPARNRDIGAGEFRRLPQFQYLTFLDDMSAPGKQLFPVKQRAPIRPGNGKCCCFRKTQFEWKSLDLDDGSICGITGQNIADLERQRIHGTASRNSDVTVTGATEVLHGVEGAGFDNLDHSSIPVGMKRTVSPGAKRAGAEEAGSNICKSA